MWGMFVVAVFATTLMVFVPGVFVLRAMRLPWFASLACAPLLTVAASNVLALVYCKVGIACTWLTVFGPLVLVGAVAFVVARVFRVRGSVQLDLGVCDCRMPERFPRWLTFDAACMACSVVVGLLVTCFVYLVPVATPDAYVESFDNVHHLAQVRAFADAQWWTSLGNTLYLGEDAYFDPFTGGGFYPSAWHVLAAAVVQLAGVSVAAAMNAVNTVLLAVVLPLGTVAFVRVVFRNHPGVVAWSAVLATTFASGPLYFLVWGPLYANLMAQCLVPAVLFAFVELFADDVSRRVRVTCAAAMIVGFIALFFAQPNGVFSAGLVLAPLCVALATRKTSKHFLQKGMVPARALRYGRLAGLGMLVLIVGIWTACFLAPFMHDVVMYHWNPEYSTPHALSFVMGMSYFARGCQYIGMALVVVGSITCFVRGSHRWLVVSFVLTTVIYVVCVSTDGMPKQFLAGFWYTDSPRVAAIVALVAIPLQAVGADAIVRGAFSWARAFGWDDKYRNRGTRGAYVIAAVAVAIILVFFFAPYSRHVPGRWGGIDNEGNPLVVRAEDNARQYAASNAKIYDEKERAFVDEVFALVGPDAVVINEPNDGSAYSYGAQGLHTYYRYWRGYGEDDEKATSKTVRKRLKFIATDENVQAAVCEIGAEYVLELDYGHHEIDIARMWTYEDGKNWVGIDGVRDGTPGFEVVLSCDDMRLYRIVV